MASPAGFEPATYSLEGCCSIQLSYGPISGRRTRLYLEQVMGIEPTQSAWKAEVLPLNYTCMFHTLKCIRNYTRIISNVQGKFYNILGYVNCKLK